MARKENEFKDPDDEWTLVDKVDYGGFDMEKERAAQGWFRWWWGGEVTVPYFDYGPFLFTWQQWEIGKDGLLVGGHNYVVNMAIIFY
jgi:hypothetical protein